MYRHRRRFWIWKVDRRRVVAAPLQACGKNELERRDGAVAVATGAGVIATGAGRGLYYYHRRKLYLIDRNRSLSNNIMPANIPCKPKNWNIVDIK